MARYSERRKPDTSRATTAVLAATLLLIAWGVFAFGSVYPWAYTPLAVGCADGQLHLFSLPDGKYVRTLAGHVSVADWATIGAFSGIHQFCRVGAHAFLGGYTVATQDVLPFSKTVGNRACNYGPNLVGLTRRGFEAESVRAIRQAFRVLLQSRLTTGQALERLDAEGPHTPEVRLLVDFIRSSERGVILKRGRSGDDEA